MASAKQRWLWINVIGGIAVLGSYAHGLATHPTTSAEVWGGVPDQLRPLYTVSMLCAATGYFLFSSFVLLRLDAERTRIGGFGFGLLNALYALILIPSALWMPLTFAMLEQPGPALWFAIRATLALVGIGSIGLLAALAAVEASGARVPKALAIVGAAAFSFQTAVLDAIVWPYYFPTS